MQPQREGYDEPVPTGHPDATLLNTSSGCQVNLAIGVRWGSYAEGALGGEKRETGNGKAGQEHGYEVH